MATRLSTDQFLALRSIAKEAWDMREGRIQWRFNGKWFYVHKDGLRTDLSAANGKGGNYGYDAIYARAWNAAFELEMLELVETSIVRCCPGTSCHANDRRQFRLTERGTALLQKAGVGFHTPKAQPETETEPVPPEVVDGDGNEVWWRKAASFLPWHRAS
jgi:hypothetical protein